jgi:hypothetical protein
MSEHALANDAAAMRAERPFFVWMAGYCVLLTFAGFTPTYWALGGPILSAKATRHG